MRTTVTDVFKISYVGLGPTEIHLIALLANTLIYFFGNPLLQLPWITLSAFDLVAALLAALILAAFMVETIRQARELRRLEEEAVPQIRPSRAARSQKAAKPVQKRKKLGAQR